MSEQVGAGGELLRRSGTRAAFGAVDDLTDAMVEDMAAWCSSLD